MTGFRVNSYGLFTFLESCKMWRWLPLIRWVKFYLERAYGDETLASFGFRSSNVTYIICYLITPADLSLQLWEEIRVHRPQALGDVGG